MFHSLQNLAGHAADIHASFKRKSRINDSLMRNQFHVIYNLDSQSGVVGKRVLLLLGYLQVSGQLRQTIEGEPISGSSLLSYSGMASPPPRSTLAAARFA